MVQLPVRPCSAQADRSRIRRLASTRIVLTHLSREVSNPGRRDDVAGKHSTSDRVSAHGAAHRIVDLVIGAERQQCGKIASPLRVGGYRTGGSAVIARTCFMDPL